MGKEVEHICKNCGLYNRAEGICGVTVIKEGEYLEVSTNPEDRCLWEEMGVEVEQVRIWSDGKNGYIERTA